MARLLGGLAALALLALPLHATWSICVVDTATGETAVATATCIANDDLTRSVPVLLVGLGAGAEQSVVDPSGVNRVLMHDLLALGTPPAEVLQALLTQGSSPNSKQYGVAGIGGPPATYSGASTSDALGNLVGTVGSLSYAIQGNVLTGPEVVFAAEEALRDTPGDLSQKMIAAMEAAAAYGGDGRCSCSVSDPTGCGSPPASFTKSAHVGLLYVARIGDTDGVCNGTVGCANGDYWLKLDVIGDVQDPDPVVQLRGLYDAWRAAHVGSPDGLLSTASPSAQALAADGVSSARVTVRLVDVDGTPLAAGGASVAVALSPASDAADVVIGPVTDVGDGSYSFEVTAGTTAGTAELVITADDGVVDATLYPYPSLRVDAVTPLHVGFDTVDPAGPVDVPLTLNVPGAAGGQHLVLASLSGTSPGTPFGGVVLPLNADVALLYTLANANGPALVGTFGLLDAAGHGEARFVAPAGELLPLVGARVDWAALWLAGATLGATNAAGFDLVSGG